MPSPDPTDSAAQRADVALVARGLFESRAMAQAAIAAGLVSADGTMVRKASAPLRADAVVEASRPHPWVSRGGVKLAAALDAFRIDPAGRVGLDVGASTGGFTHVLLDRGASLVHAIDVGTAQLHDLLRADSRVLSREGCDIPSLAAGELVPEPSLVVVDVSFIPLRLVLPALSALATEAADLVVLVKPQFEAGRGQARKGIVRDPAVHAAICDQARVDVTEAGWAVTGLIPSPIAGGDGNSEFLLGATRQRRPSLG